MLDGRKEKKQTKKQRNKIKLDIFIRSRMLLLSNILCSKWTPWFGTKMSNIMKENDERYLSLTCWTSLEVTMSVCLADFFNFLGTTSSSSVETTSKYNSSAIIFKFYFNNQELLQLVTISLILDSGVILGSKSFILLRSDCYFSPPAATHFLLN